MRERGLVLNWCVKRTLRLQHRLSRSGGNDGVMKIQSFYESIKVIFLKDIFPVRPHEV